MTCSGCIYLREDYEYGEEGAISVERFCTNKLSKKGYISLFDKEKCPYYKMKSYD